MPLSTQMCNIETFLEPKIVEKSKELLNLSDCSLCERGCIAFRIASSSPMQCNVQWVLYWWGENGNKLKGGAKFGDNPDPNVTF